MYVSETMQWLLLGAAILLFIVFKYVRRGRGSTRPEHQKSLTLGLSSTRERLALGLKKIVGIPHISPEFWKELEGLLIQSDIGIPVTQQLMKKVSDMNSTSEVYDALKMHLTDIFPDNSVVHAELPHVILIVGVNGVGKTTTIAKLAKQYIDQNKRVLLVAGDTFRAAAIDQLKVWADRLGCDIVSQLPGADSASVAFDGVQKGIAKKYDIVLIDTAGRLHTKDNLMDELAKVSRVIAKAMPSAPHERLLVLDATVGSNGLNQAKKFHEMVGLTGAIITKLDGTAKGGIVFAISGELKIPITHIGIGESMMDLRPFHACDFVDAIVGEC